MSSHLHLQPRLRMHGAITHPHFFIGVVSKHMQNLNFQLQENKIWRNLQSHEGKFLFSKTVTANKSRPKRCVQHVANLRPIKNAIPFLAATQ